MVVDASALIEWLLQTANAAQIARRLFTPGEAICAPELLSLDVTQALRRLLSLRGITLLRAHEAVQDLKELRVNYYPHMLLLPRIWELRNNFTAYDAAYVALAEQLEVPLITCDRKLAAAHGHQAQIESF